LPYEYIIAVASNYFVDSFGILAHDKQITVEMAMANGEVVKYLCVLASAAYHWRA
jgi:hypothetical protein